MIQGKRHDLTNDDEVMREGEYGKHWFNGDWYGVPPGHPELLAGLAKHTVVEHEDGTITVSPSILVSSRDEQWHGYLERGIWREV